jgi:catechol 2,3-dioxygenase-like lactoylglutathione lyase family enzyme
VSAARAMVVAELLVSDLQSSLQFWCDQLRFNILYERPEEHFAYLDLNGAQFMLEEYRVGKGRYWVTDTLQKPYGRGINFEIKMDDISVALKNLDAAKWPLYMQPEEKWYRVGSENVGVLQFLVQDPDGYLLRLSQPIGRKMQ